jgi:hypothetical protein
MVKTTVTTTDDDDTEEVEGTETGTEEVEGTETGTEESDEDDPEDEEAAVIATFTPAQAALWTKHQEALTKANANARSKRLALKALRSGQQAPSTGPKPTAPKTTTGKPETFDPEAFKTALLAELQGVQQADKVQRAAERGLKAAGLVLPEGDAGERKLARVMRMLDLDGSTPDDVADEIDDLKADHPELFKAMRKRPKTGGVSGPSTIGAGKAKKPEDELFD